MMSKSEDKVQKAFMMESCQKGNTGYAMHHNVYCTEQLVLGILIHQKYGIVYKSLCWKNDLRISVASFQNIGFMLDMETM